MSFIKKGICVERVFVRPLRATKPESSSDPVVKLERGFRWDPALQRWVEEKRNTGKKFSASDMIIKTKTGDEYMVRKENQQND